MCHVPSARSGSSCAGAVVKRQMKARRQVLVVEAVQSQAAHVAPPTVSIIASTLAVATTAVAASAAPIGAPTVAVALLTPATVGHQALFRPVLDMPNAPRIALQTLRQRRRWR